MCDNISVDLSPDCQTSLNNILSKHVKVFVDKPGCTRTVSHSIKLRCLDPIWTPSYTIPANIESAFQKSLEELIALKIVEPSSSKWSSPPIPIVKKMGRYALWWTIESST